jgi:hypothetical protein
MLYLFPWSPSTKKGCLNRHSGSPADFSSPSAFRPGLTAGSAFSENAYQNKNVYNAGDN